MGDDSPARRRVRPSRTTTADRHRAIVRACRLACESGDRAGLAAILHPRVVALTDGDGSMPAGTQSTEGAQAVIGAIFRAVGQQDVVLSEEAVNGQAGVVLRRSSRVVGIMCFSVRGQLISQVWIISGEDRLRSWNRV